jgi:valyl-tRNA synthetase
VLTGIRRAKSEVKASMRADVVIATVKASPAQTTRLRQAADDIAAAGRIATLELVEGDGPLTIDVTLADA